MKTKTSPYFLIIGLGTSGLSMAKFLSSRGKNVVATDIDASRSHVAKQLNALGIKTQIGFHNQETFNRAKVMVPSPGIPLTNKFIKTAADNGVGITGELDIFSRYNDLPIIAITGTNGKTTTTTLIGDMLKACGMNPFVGGNIGTPLVDHLMDKKNTDIIVAEISSFQLDLAKRFKPDVGVLLNISEDHLDRYDSYSAYKDSKWRIFKHQDASDKAIINQSVNEFDKKSQKLKSMIFAFSSQKSIQTQWGANIGSDTIDIITKNVSHKIKAAQVKGLQGRHNRENIAAAVLACLGAGAKMSGILKGLKTFKNLAHRIEFIKTINGISFYNDSKATNTDAVIRALECFDNNIILILGGREKDTDFSLLIKAVKQKVKTIVAIGESKTHIKNTFETVCIVKKAQTMNHAVQKAFDSAAKNDIILLSPACASFDMYENYASRGDDFVNCVTRLGN
ncbi:UDP-N-acetylmuramoyl-L-alanine--D-glutamate ligase [Desulfobacula toluolica]|uniref:UDP-N-acetylmuramoylalanine--D-glutamate ligase n=1 Tax=Desulfobacula toluolica (strain DSM 7467 / Tol2) TaxID=651182 RepID=K0NEM8_DESTT|nr:UDP-N-acetylmuramoyl-L-alanine--D-glutamate ligase [Desulfobacula toluolica]CCK79375.1 MurD: UDP-N-acetylmuramoyl-L-alanine-D-glutamate ligase [Desulfobacula toluolica Tol2]